MRIHAIASSFLACTILGSSLLATPLASAAEVEVNKNTCVITFSEAELAGLDFYFHQEDSTSERLIAEFPEQEANITTAITALGGSMIRNNDFSLTGISESDAAAYERVINAMEAKGITFREASYVIFAAVWDEYFTNWLATDAQALAGSRNIPQQKAEKQVADLQSFYAGAEITAALTSETARTLVEPRVSSITKILQTIATPYIACVNSEAGSIFISPEVPSTRAASGSSFGSS